MILTLMICIGIIIGMDVLSSILPINSTVMRTIIYVIAVLVSFVGLFFVLRAISKRITKS